MPAQGAGTRRSPAPLGTAASHVTSCNRSARQPRPSLAQTHTRCMLLAVQQQTLCNMTDEPPSTLQRSRLNFSTSQVPVPELTVPSLSLGQFTGLFSGLAPSAAPAGGASAAAASGPSAAAAG